MLTKNDVQRALIKGLDFPPFSVELRPETSEVPASRRFQPDFLLSVRWAGVVRDFAVEYQSTPGLSRLRSAIAQAKALAYSNPAFLPMVLMPYLSPEALDELVRAEISGLDLSGNGVIYVPGSWFAQRTGAPNKFPDSAPIVSPYRGNQSIVARAFLAQPAFGKQTELVSYLSESGIAPSTVSKMLTAMEQDLLITKKPDIRVVRPDALLDRLRQDYSPPVSRYGEKVRLLGSETAWAQINKNVAERGMRYAISNPERYTVLPRSSSAFRVFTNSVEDFLAGLEYSPDERFPTLELIETASRVPFFDKRFTIDRWWTSPIQEYLELANGSKREAETAVAIRKQILQLDQPATLTASSAPT